MCSDVQFFGFWSRNPTICRDIFEVSIVAGLELKASDVKALW